MFTVTIATARILPYIKSQFFHVKFHSVLNVRGKKSHFTALYINTNRFIQNKNINTFNNEFLGGGGGKQSSWRLFTGELGGGGECRSSAEYRSCVRNIYLFFLSN